MSPSAHAPVANDNSFSVGVQVSGMSRFSSIDGQHTALRDLERQRLEKLMGQLRREVRAVS